MAVKVIAVLRMSLLLSCSRQGHDNDGRARWLPELPRKFCKVPRNIQIVPRAQKKQSVMTREKQERPFPPTVDCPSNNEGEIHRKLLKSPVSYLCVAGGVLT